MENTDRVRASTAAEINRQIDRRAEDCVREYAGKGLAEIDRRILELEQE